VTVSFETDDETVKEAIEKFADQIKRSTLADQIAGVRSGDINIGKDVKVNNISVWIGVKKI
jgi:hypothetical protein